MSRRVAWTLGLAAVVVATACITINVYFPEAAVRELSEQIEDEVAEQAGEAGSAEPVSEPAPSPTPEAASGEELLSLILSFGATTAWAEDEVPSPGITNPAIRKIIDSRAARLEAINELKAKGVLGENKNALLELRSPDALTSLKERAAAQRLVKDENSDREQLFKEIAAAENVDLSQLDRIRETYAETIRAKARPGDWVQLPDGSWQQKSDH